MRRTGGNPSSELARSFGGLSHGPRGGGSGLRAFVVLLGILFFASAAGAELAVLANGDVLKIESYTLEGERMRLGLSSGGTITLGIDRVERIVDDEVVEITEPPTPTPRVAVAVLPSFGLLFSESHTVPEAPFGELIYDAARRHQLNPRLLVAMARAESAFDSKALSHKGARGLLQLMPATAERFGIKAADLFDPASNIDAASRYLRFLIKEFEGDLEHVLAAYNAGEGAVRRHHGVPPYRETRNYIARIYRFLGIEA